MILNLGKITVIGQRKMPYLAHEHQMTVDQHQFSYDYLFLRVYE